jgi:hypothetical protein
MAEENQTNKTDTKPILNTKPAEPDIIYESFSQNDAPSNPIKGSNLSNKD